VRELTQASFPHDVEVIASKNQPPCASHNFVIQQDSSHTLYGVSLRVWSRADEKRKDTITELRKRSEPGFSPYGADAEDYWIPYSYVPIATSVDR
jgi:uDENN domain